MSFINGSPLAGLGATPTFEYERPQNENAQTVSYAGGSHNDGFRNTPISLPIAYPDQNPGSSDGLGSYGDGSSAGTLPGDQSFMSGIMSTLQNLMQQIASYFGTSGGQNSLPGTTAGTGFANPPVPGQTQPPETNYASATASSWGDPHDTFSGTTAQGATVGDKWDSMTGHGDLLDSDSFHGGYRVSTTTTAPNANGVTYNASATVSTHGGADAVTLNKDGSYAVTENGHSVTLTQGQATEIGRSESVTLNADKSLTIVDTNHQGGTLSTTLSENGNGVDVNAKATNVDLGGYLVDKTDRDADPAAFAPSSGYTPPAYAANAGSSQQTPASAYGQFLNRMQYGSATEPLGAGELEFA